MPAYSSFRIGALMLVLLGAAHLLVHSSQANAQPLNGSEVTLQHLLNTYRTNIMGTMRSKGEIYTGLSLSFSVFSFALGALGFLLPVQRKYAIAYSITLILMTAISLEYWFILPTALVAAACICYTASALLNR